jgi:hypothetical protein
MVPMIENLQQGTINLGDRLFPYMMENFDFLPPLNDIKFISDEPDHPKAAIFQVASF